MAKIYLIRHGESVANTQGIYQGQTYDTPLSNVGWQQAGRLAERLDQVDLDRVIASPLQRTQMTAQVVVGNRNLSVESEARITETNHGLWEGLSKDVIAARWPDLYKKWQKFPSSVQFPEGEHFLETQKRVRVWWQEMLQTNQQNLAVVTHYNIIQIIVAHLLNMKLNRIWRFDLQPTSVTCIEIDSGQAQIRYLGNIEHLESLSFGLALHAL